MNLPATIRRQGPTHKGPRQSGNQRGHSSQRRPAAQSSPHPAREGRGVTFTVKKLLGVAGGQRTQAQNESSGGSSTGNTSASRLRRFVPVYTAKAKQRLAVAPEPRRNDGSEQESESERDEEGNATVTSAPGRGQVGPSRLARSGSPYPPANARSTEDVDTFCCFPLKSK